VTPADWRSLIEQYLTDDIDADSFKDDFLEAWKTALEEKSKIPAVVENLYTTVEAFSADGDDAETELREAAELALEELKS
jgi:Bacterial self-protective colicin-like immunity